MRPSLGSVAEELYARLEPFHERINPDRPSESITDAALGWPLLIYWGLIASQWQEIDDLSRDSDAGPGWSALLDIDRIPDKGLPYIAQFKGKSLLPGMTPADARARIRGTDGFDRGAASAIRIAAQRHLTGTKTVNINERFANDPWQLGVVTYVTETPDPVQTFNDIIEQKPYGIKLTHSVVNAYNYEVLRVAFDDYNAIMVHYADYQGVRDNVPPAP